MRYYPLLYSVIIFLTFFESCNYDLGKCEQIQEWGIHNYRIVKSECPDLVLAKYFSYSVHVGDIKKGSGVKQVDSCKFTWQQNNESFVTFNVCDNIIHELKCYKIPLNSKSIDSVTIYSDELCQTKLLTRTQIENLVKDWNNSKVRDYSDEPFDSAFSFFPAYQYKLIVFSQGNKRPFYGYNYLILDSSNWRYEMSKSGDLGYFHNYWKHN
jgi:hypothetical protein